MSRGSRPLDRCPQSARLSFVKLPKHLRHRKAQLGPAMIKWLCGSPSGEGPSRASGGRWRSAKAATSALQRHCKDSTCDWACVSVVSYAIKSAFRGLSSSNDGSGGWGGFGLPWRVHCAHPGCRGRHQAIIDLDSSVTPATLHSKHPTSLQRLGVGNSDNRDAKR